MVYNLFNTLLIMLMMTYYRPPVVAIPADVDVEPGQPVLHPLHQVQRGEAAVPVR